VARAASARELHLARQVDEAEALIAQIDAGGRREPQVAPMLDEARRTLAMALYGLGSEQASRDAFDEARVSFERGLSISAAALQHTEASRRLAAVLNNLALRHFEKLEVGEAEGLLRTAIGREPDYAQAHFNLSRVLLMRGNYAEGWRENEWRWDCPEFPSTWREFPYPWWDGGSLSGKRVLIWSEQGIGDEIMFASVIPNAIAEAQHVILECNARLVPLCRRSFPTATVVARRDPPDPAIAAARPDTQMALASLCVRFRSSKQAFAANPGRYVLADPERSSALRARYQALDGNGPVVGICWRSGNPKVGHERSAPLELWDAILRQPGLRFVSLQYGDVDSDIAGVKKRLGITIHRDTDVDPLTSAEDWFAQVAALDHVISIDNSTIQVSGALGVPTWCLLSYSPEWRFGLAGSDHDWHPSIRVFRQPARGQWAPVFHAVEQELASL
jgi:hypothetical protein